MLYSKVIALASLMVIIGTFSTVSNNSDISFNTKTTGVMGRIEITFESGFGLSGATLLEKSRIADGTLSVAST